MPTRHTNQQNAEQKQKQNQKVRVRKREEQREVQGGNRGDYLGEHSVG
jgi:hypothetical protein